MRPEILYVSNARPARLLWTQKDVGQVEITAGDPVVGKDIKGKEQYMIQKVFLPESKNLFI